MRAVLNFIPILTYQKVTCQKSAKRFCFRMVLFTSVYTDFVEIFVQSSSTHIFLWNCVFAKWDTRRPQSIPESDWSHKYFWKTFTGVCLTGVATYWTYNFKAKINSKFSLKAKQFLSKIQKYSDFENWQKMRKNFRIQKCKQK